MGQLRRSFAVIGDSIVLLEVVDRCAGQPGKGFGQPALGAQVLQRIDDHDRSHMCVPSGPDTPRRTAL
jgi:hypothetical protein